jgi:signal transduction histidine kinase
MLKRPRFFIFLICIYFIYAITGLFIAFSNNAKTYDIANYAEMGFISSAYIGYFWGLFMFLISFALFYNLLALRIHGWLLQVVFSAFFIFASFQILSGGSELYNSMPIGNMPKFLVIVWLFFNGYTLYYFLTPEIRNMFFSPQKSMEIKNEELINFLHLTDQLSMAHKTGQFVINNEKNEVNIVPEVKKVINKTAARKNTQYLPTARILITPLKKMADIEKKQELERMINRKARDIIRMLSTILPALKDKHVIDYDTYKYYKNFSWEIEDIIKDFKMRAVIYCEDKSSFGDKMMKYSKKVDELEVLEKTCELMSQWLNETGNEIGSLIQLEHV